MCVCLWHAKFIIIIEKLWYTFLFLCVIFSWYPFCVFILLLPIHTPTHSRYRDWPIVLWIDNTKWIDLEFFNKSALNSEYFNLYEYRLLFQLLNFLKYPVSTVGQKRLPLLICCDRDSYMTAGKNSFRFKHSRLCVVQ